MLQFFATNRGVAANVFAVGEEAANVFAVSELFEEW